MIRISHRGNLFGPNKERENTTEYIEEAAKVVDFIEIDVYFQNGVLYLGHDKPETNISWHWISSLSHKLIIHCKNVDALRVFCKSRVFKFFYHKDENFTPICNSDYFWSKDYDAAINCEFELSNSITYGYSRMTTEYFYTRFKGQNTIGLCSDWVGLL